VDSTNTISAGFHRDFKSKLAPEMLGHLQSHLLALRVVAETKTIQLNTSPTKDIDGEYDVGTWTREQDFLGIQVDLLGQDGSHSLEIADRWMRSIWNGNENFNAEWEQVAPEFKLERRTSSSTASKSRSSRT
jgi:hypothetical protein